MKKTEATPMHRSLRREEHDDDRVAEHGWFAEFRTDKKVKIRPLICPRCLNRMGIKNNQLNPVGTEALIA